MARVLTEPRGGRVGSAGSTTGRPTGEPPNRRRTPLGQGRYATRRTATGSQAQRPRSGTREGSGRPAGATRVGPGGSVDNGFRSTRSQRVPGRPEGHRAPIPCRSRHRATRPARTRGTPGVRSAPPPGP
ncbi:hypothetical protein SFR_6303 [Streptomyces sp. FR-008]|nr:hypothetical protein SFR_6303 [Streptomyces sp. FR-008]